MATVAAGASATGIDLLAYDTQNGDYKDSECTVFDPISGKLLVCVAKGVAVFDPATSDWGSTSSYDFVDFNTDVADVAPGPTADTFLAAVGSSSVRLFTVSTASTGSTVFSPSVAEIRSLGYDVTTDTIFVSAKDTDSFIVSSPGGVTTIPLPREAERGANTMVLTPARVWSVSKSSTITVAPRSDPAAAVAYEVGCCDYVAVAYAPLYNRIFVATSDSFVIVFAEDTLPPLVVGLAFSTGSIESMVYDPAGDALFLITTGPTQLVRLDPDTLTVVDTHAFTPITSITSARSLAVVPGTSLMFTVTDSDPSRMYKFQTHDCSVYTACGTCMADGYCAWCSSSMTCTEKYDSLCAVPAACPALLSATPSSLIIEDLAVATITLTGTDFVDVPPPPPPTGQFVALFTGLGSVPVSFSSPTTLTLVPPPGPVGSYAITLVHRGLPYASGSVDVNYVSCGTGNSSCAACLAIPGDLCAWCPSAGGFCASTTTASSSCAAPSLVASTSCPTVLSLLPSKGDPAGGTTVTVSASGLVDLSGIPGLAYHCVFNSTNAVTASYAPPNTLSCTSPSGSISGGTVPLDIALSASLPLGPGNAPFIPSTPAQSFVYQTCGEASNCAECAFGSVSCFWCADDSSCRDVSLIGTCGASNTFSSCPAITSFEPPTLPLGSPPTSVVVSGSGIDASMSCLFNASATNPAAGVVLATTFLPGSPPSLSCMFPAMATSIVVDIGLSASAQRISAVDPTFVVYDCAPPGSSCEACTSYVPASPASPPCGFCVATGLCAAVEACPPSSPFATTTPQCPALASVAPAAVGAPGGTEVTVTLAASTAGFPPPGPASDGLLTCSFTAPGSPLLAPLTVVGSHTGTCAAPGAGATLASRSVAVVTAGTGYIVAPSAVALSYYGCAGATCSECAGASGPDCGWCLETGTCTTGAGCSGGMTLATTAGLCPTIASVVPASGAMAGGTAVTVTGSLFVDGTDYTCTHASAAGSSSPTAATRVSATELTCAMPPGSAAVSGAIVVLKGGLLYSSGSSFSYYECGAASACAECVVSLLPECNWCSENKACVAGATCAAPDVAGGTRTCPEAAVVTPPAPPSSAGVTAAIVVVVLVVLLIAAALAAFYIYTKRKAADDALQPVKLTPKIRRAVAYGAVSARAPGPLAAGGRAAMEAAFVSWPPDYTAALALAEVVGSADADGLAKALVHVYEANDQGLSFLTQLVQTEIGAALSLNTLFRTNSLATKVFKVYSKIRGIDYLSETLGQFLAEAVSKYGRVEVDASRVSRRDDPEAGPSANSALIEDDVDVNRFKLLTLCQSGWVRIQHSADAVPTHFRELFAVVQAATAAKFPVALGSLAHSVHETMSAASASLDSAQATSAALLAALASPGLSADERDALLTAWSENLETIAADYELVGRSVEDQVAAQDPSSAAAARVLARLESDVRAVTVGGFFFLRFLVPALTAPHAYGLLEQPPGKGAQRLLILVAKVIQNLSNGKEFGAKEPFMTKMNEFVVANHDAMASFLDTLSAGSRGSEPTPLAPGCEVPPDHLDVAYATLARLITAREAEFSAAFLRLAGANDGQPRLLALLEALQAPADTAAADRVRAYSTTFAAIDLDRAPSDGDDDGAGAGVAMRSLPPVPPARPQSTQ